MSALLHVCVYIYPEWGCLVSMEVRKGCHILWNRNYRWFWGLCGFWEPSPGSMQEPQALLTAEPSLKPPFMRTVSLLRWKSVIVSRESRLVFYKENHCVSPLPVQVNHKDWIFAYKIPRLHAALVSGKVKGELWSVVRMRGRDTWVSFQPANGLGLS